MKRFLFLALVALVGCVTSGDEGTSSRPAMLPRDGQYQSTDNALLFTLSYPNWSASYYSKTPVLNLEGRIDSVQTVYCNGFPGTDTATCPNKVYLAYFRVTAFSQKGSDGAMIPTDSSVVRALGFSGPSLSYSAEFYQTLMIGETLRKDSTFAFTGHKLR